MPDYIDLELQPLANKLRARYPAVRIVWAHITTLDDGTKQQTVRYQAPFVELKRAGLLTDEMLRLSKCKRSARMTALGEGFHVCHSLDDESRPGYHDLTIFTEAKPRERPRIGTAEAKRLLRRIAKAVQS